MDKTTMIKKLHGVQTDKLILDVIINHLDEDIATEVKLRRLGNQVEKQPNYVEVVLLKCVHCDEYHTDDLDMMEQHLKECLANPSNKACLMCKNLTQYNDLIDGKPQRIYKCNKLNKVLDDLDMALTGATCFEERDIKQVVKENTERYTNYMQRVVEKIQKTTE